MQQAGDGTTLTTMLTYSLVKEGIKFVDEQGINPMVIRKQMEKALPRLVEEIKRLTQPVKTKEQIRHVAYACI